MQKKPYRIRHEQVVSAKAPLGEAILRGNGGELHDPVIMALQGLGAIPLDLDDSRAYQPGQYNNLAYPKEALLRLRPWLKEHVPCAWCAQPLTGAEIVAHPIVRHGEEIDLQQECEWLDQMEAEPEMRARALAVYFSNAWERRRVMDTAQKLHISPSNLIAGAIRLMLQYGLQPEGEVLQ
jgi:hypothetical protein